MEADLPLMQDEKAGSKEEVVEVVPAEGSGIGYHIRSRARWPACGYEDPNGAIPIRGSSPASRGRPYEGGHQ